MRAAGLYNNISNEEYHSDEGISSTGVSLILDCPRRYYYEYHVRPTLDADSIRKERDKFKFGRAVHMLALEPNIFHKEFYCMLEPINLTTKSGKEAYALAQNEADGRQILRSGEWAEISFMASAIRENPIWTHLQDGKAEHSVYWDGGVFNTRLRTRPDIFNDKIIVDIKTTDSIKSFKSSTFSYGYHRQAAMQIDGLKSVDGIERKFALFAVEKKAPHLTACFTLDEDSIALGRSQYLEAAAIYSECTLENNWPGYSNLAEEITLPNWLKQGEE